MAYVVRGLDPTPYKPLFGLSDEELAEHAILRMAVDGPGFPCRISLRDRAPGESVLLLNHVSHDVANPFRASHAIFVTEGEQRQAEHVDEVPPMFERVLSLRGFDKNGMIAAATLAQRGEADARIRELFASYEIATIHAHNATRGCFFAKIERN